jgi:hypothetical protein
MAIHYGFEITAQRDLKPALENQQEEEKRNGPSELKSNRGKYEEKT